MAPGRLPHRVAAKGIEPFEFHREVEALVEHAREGMGGIKPDRCEHRHHVILEAGLDPGLLLGRPGATANEDDTPRASAGRIESFSSAYCSLMISCTAWLTCEQLLRAQPVGRDASASEADLL